ncbi:hypothetical protein M3Y97_00386200 [Aphelenchoides bicaudatus]|nr:hypothetical protein M3Y97_00386200 [Aphelenchoides bicaudatus]
MTGKPLGIKSFRGIRPVCLKDLTTVAFSKDSSGDVRLYKIVIPQNQCVTYHRLSHDSTKIVGVRSYSWNLETTKTNGQIVLYDILPAYIYKRMQFPITRISMNGILFCGFNQDDSIFCAISVLPASGESQNGFLSRDPIEIQFGLMRQKSMLKSKDNLFVLNYGCSDISIFGFYSDELPTYLTHAKIFKLRRNDVKENNCYQKLDFSNGGLDVKDLFVSDGRLKSSWSLSEINPKKAKHSPNSLYFTHTHIDLERIFKYATEQLLIKRISPTAKLVYLCKCQATVIEITDDNMMQVYLSGVAQVFIPKLPPFFASSFLVSWDLETNNIRYQIIGYKSNSTPYIANLNECTTNLEKVVFSDILTYHEFFNGESVNTITSHHGDLALYL